MPQPDLLHLERITPEQINELSIIKFEGPIQVISEVKELKAAMNELRRATELGFDTEKRPSFKKGEKHPVSLLQLATREKAYLLCLSALGPHKEIYQILENPDIKKIGLALKDDLKGLHELRPFEPKSIIDLDTLAKQKKLIQTGARSLTARFLARRLSKKEQKSDWSKFPLTSSQISYAATDAWIALTLYPLLGSYSKN